MNVFVGVSLLMARYSLWGIGRCGGGGDQAAQPPQIRCALFCAAIDEGGRLVEV